jgi:hypothetical protein
MPRPTFAGIEFDLLVQGLEDRHEGMVSVREVPGSAGAVSPVVYVDLGGPRLHRRTVNVLLDNEAQYLQLAALPGTTASNGTLTDYDGLSYAVVLLSVTRYYRRGGPLPQLCRTEWLFLDEGTAVVGAGATGRLPEEARLEGAPG